MKKHTNKWISLARYLAGEMDSKEEIAFRNETDLTQMEKDWNYFNDHPSPGRKESDLAWNRLYRRLEEDGLLEGDTGKSRTRVLRPALRIAATILLILAIGIPALYLVQRGEREKQDVRTHYAEKGTQTVDLPDGSRVYLNQGSEITYPGGFDHERTVRLLGEAFFEIMSDPVNPFTVRSGNVVVSVLGTSFNVKQAGQAGEVEVYVESGKVRVGKESTGEFITLVPGEIGHIGPGRLSSSEQRDPNYISWKTKDFKFVDEELDEVLRKLEESYHVEIHAEGLDLDELRITSTYREQSIDAILETIGTAFGLNVSKKEDLYYLEQ